MTLPGGFQLPIGILCEEYITYAQSGTAENAMDLSAAAKGYILSDMTAGTILRAMETLDSTDDFLFLRGRYACSESLGITRIEENFEKYGENP